MSAGDINFSYLLDVRSSQCARNEGLQAAHAVVGSSSQFQRRISAFFAIGVASEGKYHRVQVAPRSSVTRPRDLFTQAICWSDLLYRDSLLKYATMGAGKLVRLELAVHEITQLGHGTWVVQQIYQSIPSGGRGVTGHIFP